MSDFTEGWSEADLLRELPLSVVRAIRQLDGEGTDWNVTGLLLAATPSVGVSLKGGSWRSDLWDAVRREFHSFMCTDSKEYADLRKESKGLRENGSRLALGSLSGLIGAQLGVASGIVAPLVIWLLVVSLRIGHKALCVTLSPPVVALPPAPPAS